MGGRPHVLAAVPSPALLFLEKAVGAYVRLIPSHSYEDAVGRLRELDAIALVVCGIYFDQSRMFDLMRWVRKTKPLMPFIACRILQYEIPAVSIEAVKIACEALGASFIDLPSLERTSGLDRVESELRSRLLAAIAPSNRSAR